MEQPKLPRVKSCFGRPFLCFVNLWMGEWKRGRGMGYEVWRLWRTCVSASFSRFTLEVHFLYPITSSSSPMGVGLDFCSRNEENVEG